MRCIYSPKLIDEKATEPTFKKTIVAFLCIHVFTAVICLFYCLIYMHTNQGAKVNGDITKCIITFAFFNTLLSVVGASWYTFVLLKPLLGFSLQLRTKMGLGHISSPRSMSPELEVIVSSFNRLVDSLRVLQPYSSSDSCQLDYRNVLEFVAHDLRKPFFLTSLLLQQGVKGLPVGEKHRENITKAIDNANSILESLLSRTQEKDPVYEPTSLSEVLYNSIIVASAGSSKNHIKFAYELQHTTDVLAESAQLSRVFVNLISNAIEHMPDQHEIKISTHNELEGSHVKAVRICIKNTGTYIDQDKIDKIFGMFYTTKKAHHGLGLSICKKILHCHRSDISCVSDKVEGVAFSFTLPSANRINVEPLRRDFPKTLGEVAQLLYQDPPDLLDRSKNEILSFA